MKDNNGKEPPEARGGEEKPEAGEIDVSSSPFLGKLSNFWYYHKWKVVIGAAALILISVMCLQTCRNAKEDITVMAAGPNYLSRTEVDKAGAVLSSLMPFDFSGDGEKNASFAQLHIYSEEQAKERIEKLGSDSFDAKFNLDERRNFDNIITTGEYTVWIVDPWLYGRVSESGGWRKLADVLGSVPSNAYSDEAVLFKKTALFAADPELFAGYPDDTLVCLRIKSRIGDISGKKRSDESYKQAEAFFAALVRPADVPETSATETAS